MATLIEFPAFVQHRLPSSEPLICLRCHADFPEPPGEICVREPLAAELCDDCFRVAQERWA